MKGERYGKLVLLERIAKKHKKTRWLCLCDCGKKSVKMQEDIRKGDTKSCGCSQWMRIDRVNTGVLRKGKVYNAWLQMKSRCDNENRKDYNRYGGRGIKYCEEWKEFSVFKKWAEPEGETDGLTLDRIDNDGDYEPSNCRWVTRRVQSNNRNYNVVVEIDGIKANLSKHAELSGIKYGTLWNRYNKGIRGKELISKLDNRRNY